MHIVQRSRSAYLIGLVLGGLEDLDRTEQARTLDEPLKPGHALLHMADSRVNRPQPTHNPHGHRHLHSGKSRANCNDAYEFRAHAPSLAAGPSRFPPDPTDSVAAWLTAQPIPNSAFRPRTEGRRLTSDLSEQVRTPWRRATR